MVEPQTQKEDPALAPSLAALSEKEKDALFSRILPEYLAFLQQGKTPDRVVEQAVHMAKAAGLPKADSWDPSKEGFYMTDTDEQQFALALLGKKKARDGLSVLVAHTDAPCLNLKSHPFVEGPEGLLLAAKPYGGVWPHNWVDADVSIFGRVPFKDKVVKVNLDGLLLDRGIHVTHKDVDQLKFPEAFKHEMLKVATGYPSKKAFLTEMERYGIDEEAFFRGTWFVVPKAAPALLGQELISGYGHDDRICVYASVKAALSADRTFSAVVYGCAREEIGSTGLDGAQGIFFDQAIDALLKAEGMREENMTGAIKRAMFTKSQMISGDVDVALTVYDKDCQDEQTAARLGKGLVICKVHGGQYQYDGNHASDALTASLLDTFRHAEVVYQTTESPTKLEKGGGSTIAVYFAHRGLPVIDVGPPVANMHGKYPVAHVGDLLQTIKGYTAFLERSG